MKKKDFVLIIISLVLSIVLICLCIVSITGYIKIKKEEEKYKTFEEYFNSKVEEFRKENEEINDKNICVDIVFLGDSITDNCDLKKYYSEYLAYNRGISGDTTTGLISRMKESLYDIKTKVVVMCIGANNYKNMFDDYEDLLKGIKENTKDTKVIIVSLPPLSSSFEGYNDAFIKCNNRIESYALKYNFEYIDIFTPLLDNETGYVKEGMTVDGAHPSHESYLIISSLVKEKIEEILD